ncbi:LOW QUALITY PROTEIN: transcription cofactor vestigial-like protein 1 [Nycticebus coucang]|uniref:LOW QUALITY PROTEIN: transcription cofactor vestigial-like protein 1 n=1 Tax=Nycticebus coucang TaxID=9470 RepID=UPI00234C5318|nr:LOW QUALITY PROTEIN: transcription cofactor vestigial-like protein 1 [Nycticebus coucang]
MEDMKKTAIQLPRERQKPIKTEWNSRCVLFTYFQGDISSVVDEHFSRALSSAKSPRVLSPSRQIEDVILRNDSDMSPSQWRFSSPWTKAQPEVSPENHAVKCNLKASGPVAGDQFPQSFTGRPSAQPGGMWHFSSLASPNSPDPGYSQGFPTGHLVLEPDGKSESLRSLFPQDRCLASPQESATREDCNPVQIAGSTGLLLNLPPSSVHYKKIYASPNRGPASTSLANEICSQLVPPGKYFLSTQNHWGHPCGYPQHL